MIATRCLPILGLILVLIPGALLAAPVPTAITPNGLGTAVTSPSAGLYKITGGPPIGGNLFESFSTFNLGTGSTADFNVPVGVTNILARVTGGPSTIDGTITSTQGNTGNLSNANLFFLNPAGIMFTANARLSLGGSFVLSTANEIHFSDNTIFHTDVSDPIEDAGLSSAPVSAFGFMGSAAPQPISFAGSQLTVAHGAGLDVIGGDVTLNAARLAAPGGNLTLFSAASAGVVGFDLASPGASFSTATNPKFGTIAMTANSSANIDSATGGGNVVIRGGRLTLASSAISSNDFGPQAGGDVSIQATSVDLNSSDIFANTNTTANGGRVSIDAGSMTMEGQAQVASLSFGNTGNAGTIDLTLHTGPLLMSDSAAVAADTYTGGAGGNVTISAPGVRMTGRSLITANTSGSGLGGTVTIDAGLLSIRGNTPGAPAGVTAQSFAAGQAGDIVLHLDTLDLEGNATVSTASYSSGNGGSVIVACTEGTVAMNSSISASAQVADGGTVSVRAGDTFTLLDGGSLTTSAGSNGGSISVEVARLLYLDDSNIQAFAGVTQPSGQHNTSAVHGGNMTIDPEFVILNGSFISANDLSPLGSDGNIVNETTFFFTSESFLHATGTIETTAPDLNLGQKLALAQVGPIDEQSKLRESCARSIKHEFSTLIQMGRGGTESGPDELQPDFGVALTSLAGSDAPP